MFIETFCLCDAATGDGGKLSMLGAFDTIWAEKAPVAIPQCAVALRVRFSSIEQGEHRVKVTIVDADGKNILQPMEGGIRVAMPADRRTVAMNMILNLHGASFQKYGEYAVELAMDGRQEASLPLFVARPPGAGRPPAPPPPMGGPGLPNGKHP